jgi:hypothetical protein
MDHVTDEEYAAGEKAECALCSPAEARARRPRHRTSYIERAPIAASRS